MKKQIIHHHHREKGFSLLEVLVSILLIALGIVTMVMLQSRALQYSSAAFYQGLGMQVANGLAASIRANPGGASSYSHSGDYNPAAAISAAPNNCYSGACTPAQMAASDIVWARQSVRALLPGGDVFMNKSADFIDVVFVWEGAQTKDNIRLPCDDPAILAAVTGVSAAENAQCLLLRVKV